MNRQLLKFLLVFAVVAPMSCGVLEDAHNSQEGKEGTPSNTEELPLEYNDSEDGICYTDSLVYDEDAKAYVKKKTEIKETKKKSSLKRIKYYIDSSTYKNAKSLLPNIEDFEKVFPNSVVQAAEIWNSESQAPPFIFGASISLTQFKSLRTNKENHAVFITFIDDCRRKRRYNPNTGKSELVCDPGILAVTSSITPTTLGDPVTKHFISIHLKVVYSKTETHGSNKVKYESDMIRIPWRVTVDEPRTLGGIEYHLVENTGNVEGIPERKTFSITSPILRSVIAHEFGHVLGLGHNETKYGRSIMTPRNDEARLLHLWNWDKKCIRAIYGDRDTVYKSSGVDFLGEPESGIAEGIISVSSNKTVSEPTTSKASRLGMNQTVSGTLEKASILFAKHDIPKNPSDTTRMFTLLREYDNDRRRTKNDNKQLVNQTISYNSLNQNLYTFDVNPTFSMLGDLKKFSGAFIYHYSGIKQLVNASSVAYDPPYISVSYLEKQPDNTLVRRNRTVTPVNYVTDESISADNRLYSHLPVSTAYNHKTGHYIQAVVDTERASTSTLWRENEGAIRFGLYTTFADNIQRWEMHDRLHRATHRIMDKIDKHEYWKPMMKTRFGVAVACTERFTWHKWDDYNCFLAWIDRGLPRRHNVLYTWFAIRYNKKQDVYDIDWKNKVYVRNDFYAVGHLSAAYVGGALVMVAKSAGEKDGGGSKIMLTYNRLNKSTGFGTHIYTFGENVVDAPSVGAVRYKKYDPGNDNIEVEANDGLIAWTELE